MKINSVKRKANFVTEKKTDISVGHKSRNKELHQTNNCKHLGVILNKDLNWSELIRKRAA